MTYSGSHLCKQAVNDEWPNALTGNYLENRNADTNEQILYDRPLLDLRDYPSFPRSNLVEAAIDAK